MLNKIFELPQIGKVIILKRRNNHNLRLSFDDEANIKVSIPIHASYNDGLHFVSKKQDWIKQHRPAPRTKLQNGQRIIDNFELCFTESAFARKCSSSVQEKKIIIKYPTGLGQDDTQIQLTAERAIKKILKIKAEGYLPSRLEYLANEFGYKYSSCSIKAMRRRWGSCDIKGKITLNLYLVNLPNSIIDYVLLHELAHTLFPHHQPSFWAEVERTLPNYKPLKKFARQTKPSLTLANWQKT